MFEIVNDLAHNCMRSWDHSPGSSRPNMDYFADHTNRTDSMEASYSAESLVVGQRYCESVDNFDR